MNGKHDHGFRKYKTYETRGHDSQIPTIIFFYRWLNAVERMTRIMEVQEGPVDFL